MKLMKNKTLQSISVTDIANTAGISRMTYYRNYGTKEQILREYMKLLTRDYVQALGNAGVPRCNHTHILCAVRCFYQNREFVDCLERAGMSQILLEGITCYLLQAYAVRDDDFTGQCTLRALAGAVYAICMHWFREGMRQSQEQVADVIVHAIKGMRICEAN